jgi:hypothetical protein
MLNILNCVNCDSIDWFTRIYPCETSIGFLFDLYLDISFFRMHSRYSDVSLKNDMWRKKWIRNIEGILMMLIKQDPEKWSKRTIFENGSSNVTFHSKQLWSSFLRPKIPNKNTETLQRGTQYLCMPIHLTTPQISDSTSVLYQW